MNPGPIEPPRKTPPTGFLSPPTQPSFPDAKSTSDEQTPSMYVVTGIVIDGAGMSRGRQLLLMTENIVEAEEYRDSHKALFPDGPYTSVMFGTPQIREIKILQCPIVG